MRRRRQQRKTSQWFSPLLILGTLGSLLWLEQRRPLRKRQRENKLRHDARNMTMSAMTAAAVNTFEKPLVEPLCHWVDKKNFGLVKWMRLPQWLEIPLAIILLDYTLYIWHVLTHKAPLLWRFHEVHHVDLDMDTTTALRFHFAEMIASAPWRAAQVLTIGASRKALSTWQTLTLLAILFHHSNVELPHALEKRLCRLIVTPRMHGIHHSIIQKETDSNWSTIFSWPDYVHKTLRLNVPQKEISIGVLAHQEPQKLQLDDLLRMPFGPHKPSWQLLEDTTLERNPLPGAKQELAT